MPDPFPLDAVASVVLNGSGAGTVQIGPTRARQVWRVTAIGVRVTPLPATNEAEARVFVNGSYYAGSFSGSSGDNTDADVILRRGNVITVQWIGGDAGGRAEVTVSGMISLE